jgi:hypothetical protein
VRLRIPEISIASCKALWAKITHISIGAEFPQVTDTVLILEGQQTKALRISKISIPLWIAHSLFLSLYKVLEINK